MKRIIFTTCTLAVVAGLNGALAADKITEKSSGKDRTHEGRVARDDVDGVAIRVTGGITPEFRREHVTNVHYEVLERHFYTGEQQFEHGQYEVARIRLEQALDDKNVHVWAKQYVLRRLAQCNQRIGRKENLKRAAALWKQLRTLIPGGKGLFVKDAIRGGLECYTKLRMWDEASKCLVPLEKMGDDGRMMARVYRAQIAERRASSASDFGEAARKYRAVAESRPRPSEEVRASALAGFARCSIEARNWGAAADAARKIAAMKGDEVPEAALAVSYQVQGEIKVRSMIKISAGDLSKNAKKREKVEDAMLDMMRPVVQYKGSSWAEPRALYYMGYWSEKMERARQGPRWQRRARSMFETVRNSYPKSKWAKLAAGALKKMKGR